MQSIHRQPNFSSLWLLPQWRGECFSFLLVVIPISLLTCQWKEHCYLPFLNARQILVWSFVQKLRRGPLLQQAHTSAHRTTTNRHTTTWAHREKTHTNNARGKGGRGFLRVHTHTRLVLLLSFFWVGTLFTGEDQGRFKQMNLKISTLFQSLQHIQKQKHSYTSMLLW